MSQKIFIIKYHSICKSSNYEEQLSDILSRLKIKVIVQMPFNHCMSQCIG